MTVMNCESKFCSGANYENTAPPISMGKDDLTTFMALSVLQEIGDALYMLVKEEISCPQSLRSLLRRENATSSSIMAGA